jgi:tetratricopeptide (TPR) repeat protein
LLSDEELIVARWNYSKNDYKELVKWLDKSLNSNQNNYGSWLLKAIVDFYPSMGNNPQVALEDIKKAAKYAQVTHEWRYSRAFLYFWMGNYDEAFRDCKNLSQKSYVGEDVTIDEVENFNLKLLEKYEDKVQLYFWLGYINYIKKRNSPMAYKYFLEFEQKSSMSMSVLKQKSNVYLAQIKSEMKIK